MLSFYSYDKFELFLTYYLELNEKRETLLLFDIFYMPGKSSKVAAKLT